MGDDVQLAKGGGREKNGLVQYSGGVPPSLYQIPPQPPREHQVRVALSQNSISASSPSASSEPRTHLHEHFQIQNVSNGLVVQDKEAFDDDDRGAVEVGSVLRSLVQDEGVVRDLFSAEMR